MCWYADSRIVIEKLFGVDADLFCDILAATSPRKQVAANWNVSQRIYEAHKNGQEFSERGLMPCHIGNVRRALSGEPLSGNKISAFAANLKGDLSQVTIDIWTLRYFKIDKQKLTDKQYGILAEKIKRIACRLKLQPAVYQSKIWEISMRRAGKKSRSFADVSEVNQLQFEFMGN